MSEHAKWVPGDAELDTLARSSGREEPAPDRVDHNRVAILAAAHEQKQLAARSQIQKLIGIGAAAAAAVVLIAWLADRREEPMERVVDVGPKELIVGIETARFERISGWPSYELRVHDGRVAVRVEPIAPREHFRVTTLGAQLEVRGARFIVEVVLERLETVLVEEGSVELRRNGRPPIIVGAGSRWTRTATARLDVPVARKAVDRPATSTSDSPRDPLAASPRADRLALKNPNPPVRSISKDATVVRGDGDQRRPVTPRDPDNRVTEMPSATPTSESPTPTPTIESPSPERPGEAEFRRGWESLRAGTPAIAARAFTVACDSLGSDPLAEDACFWAGVAARRAGYNTDARDSLARFTSRFPRSARLGEASALLGWVLYDAGDLRGAETRFHNAAHDRVPAVRASAERGLAAITRRREAMTGNRPGHL